MKQIAIVLFVIFCASFTIPKRYVGTTYYISNTGNNLNNGTSSSTPWQTLAKLNSITLVAGDIVLLKAGDTFNEQLPVNQSGSAGNVIRFGSYGGIIKPVITAFTTLTGWTSLGSNKWEKAINAGADLNEVLYYDQFAAMGRWPDYSTIGERGYQQYETGGSKTTLTDNELVTGSGISNWQLNGTAEVVVRTVPWEIDRSLITGQSGTTLNFNALSDFTTSGSGFFIRNDIRTLTQDGEWFYQPNTKITMYSTTNPSGNVKVSTIDDLCYINGKSYITIENIKFEGADKSAIHLYQTSNVTIQDNDIIWTGNNAVAGMLNYSWSPQDNLVITRNNIQWTSNSGIDLNNFPQNNVDGSKIQSTYAHNVIVTYNTITNCGFLPGIGMFGGDQYDGIYVKADSAYVAYNIVDSVGSSGITTSHSRSFTTEKNFVRHYNMWTEDIGAIYTSHVGDTDPKTGPGVRRIWNNIVDNAGVNGQATLGYADRYGHERGIYVDETADHVDVRGNTACNSNDAGAELHRTNYITFKYNTLFNNKHQQLYMLTQAIGETFTGQTIVGNIFFSKTRDQHAMDFINWNDDISSWTANGGAWDSNWYANPTRYALWRNQINGPNEVRHWDLAAFKNAYSHETHGIETPLKFKAFTATTIGGNKATTTSYTNSNYYNVIDIGAITFGKQYLVKFNVQSSVRHHDLRFIMYEPSGNFARSDEKYSRMPTTSTPDSIILTPTQTEVSARIYIYCQNPVSYTLSSLDVREIGTLTEPPIQDSIRIDYNPSDVPILVDLGAHYWKDVKGVRYSGQVTVPAWGSVITMMDTGVLNINPPPVVSAGIDYTIKLPTNSLTVTGTATDNGSIVSRLWTRIAGPTIPTFNTPTSNSTLVSNLQVGTYQLKFSATDNQGASTSDTMQIIVQPANMLPTASAGYDLIITLPMDSVYLNGSLSNDPDGTLTYSWTKTSGSAQYTMTGATTASPKLTNLKSGTYVFTLTVTDNDGAQSADDVTIIVVPAGVIQWGIPGAPRKIIPK